MVAAAETELSRSAWIASAIARFRSAFEWKWYEMRLGLIRARSAMLANDARR